jgi:hypothetical protein
VAMSVTDPGDEVVVEVHHRLERPLRRLGDHAQGVAVHGGHGLENKSLVKDLTKVRCYDYSFQRFSPIFGEKIGVFLENQCYDHFVNKRAVF